MNLKERNDGYMEFLEEGNRKGKLSNYIIISKVKKINLKVLQESECTGM